MDRATLEQHLAQADRYLAEGQTHMEKQRTLITQRERNALGRETLTLAA
jgi:hypothetical protein